MRLRRSAQPLQPPVPQRRAALLMVLRLNHAHQGLWRQLRMWGQLSRSQRHV